MRWPLSCLGFSVVATSCLAFSVVAAFLPGFCGAGDASPCTFPGLCLPNKLLDPCSIGQPRLINFCCLVLSVVAAFLLGVHAVATFLPGSC